jgi:hypothetical protein
MKNVSLMSIIAISSILFGCTLEPCTGIDYSTSITNSKKRAISVESDVGENHYIISIDPGKTVYVGTPTFYADTGNGNYYIRADCGVVDQVLTCSCTCDYEIR